MGQVHEALDASLGDRSRPPVERVRAFYAPYRGRYPEKESQIRPRER